MKSFSKQILVMVGAAAAAGAMAGSTHPWAMYRSDMFRTGQSLYPGPDLAVSDWKYFTYGQPPTISASNSGVLPGITFHEAIWSNEEYFTVLEPTGAIDWRLKVPPYDWGASQGVFSGPALDSGGNITTNAPRGQVRKYDATGNLLWAVTGRGDVTNNSTPAIDQFDNIFHYQPIFGVTKYTPAGGIILHVGASSQSHVAVFTNGDFALGGVRTNEPHGSVDITYFNANGTVRWQKTSSNGRNGQVIFGPDNTVYQGSGAYNPDGTVKWGSPSGGHNNALGKNGQYYIDLGGSAPNIRAVNAQTGALLWEAHLPAVGAIRPIGIDSRDRIYLTTTQGYFFALSPTNGAVLVQNRIADEFLTGPVIGLNNRAYAVGKRFGKTYVYSIQ
jgi:hypothetical protein